MSYATWNPFVQDACRGMGEREYLNQVEPEDLVRCALIALKLPNIGNGTRILNAFEMARRPIARLKDLERYGIGKTTLGTITRVMEYHGVALLRCPACGRPVR